MTYYREYMSSLYVVLVARKVVDVSLEKVQMAHSTATSLRLYAFRSVRNPLVRLGSLPGLSGLAERLGPASELEEVTTSEVTISPVETPKASVTDTKNNSVKDKRVHFGVFPSYKAHQGKSVLETPMAAVTGSDTKDDDFHLSFLIFLAILTYIFLA